MSPVLNLSLQGQFTSLTNLNLGGSAVVGINRPLDAGPLGRINVTTDVRGSLGVTYQNQVASASFQGGFDFRGVHGNIPGLALNVNAPALVGIADTLWAQVSDVIRKALQSADQWLTWVKNGVVQGAGQTPAEVGQVLRTVFGLPWNVIASKTQQFLGYGVKQLAQALQGAGARADEAVQALSSLGYQAADITNAITSAFKGQHADTSFGHVDTKSPHLDTPSVHADTPTIPHGDTTFPHTDIPGFGRIPHSDTRPHVDTGSLHGDTITVPHVDTAPHVDTGTHVDVKT